MILNDTNSHADMLYEGFREAETGVCAWSNYIIRKIRSGYDLYKDPESVIKSYYNSAWPFFERAREVSAILGKYEDERADTVKKLLFVHQTFYHLIVEKTLGMNPSGAWFDIREAAKEMELLQGQRFNDPRFDELFCKLGIDNRVDDPPYVEEKISKRKLPMIFQRWLIANVWISHKVQNTFVSIMSFVRSFFLGFCVGVSARSLPSLITGLICGLIAYAILSPLVWIFRSGLFFYVICGFLMMFEVIWPCVIIIDRI